MVFRPVIWCRDFCDFDKSLLCFFLPFLSWFSTVPPCHRINKAVKNFTDILKLHVWTLAVDTSSALSDWQIVHYVVPIIICFSAMQIWCAFHSANCECQKWLMWLQRKNLITLSLFQIMKCPVAFLHVYKQIIISTGNKCTEFHFKIPSDC